SPFQAGEVITHDTMRTCSLAQINSTPYGPPSEFCVVETALLKTDAKRTLLHTSDSDQLPFCRLKSLNEK
ncbi:hypothetical protein PENTCL1PPCAC_3755, partial [Pristionchus entomophagus]